MVCLCGDSEWMMQNTMIYFILSLSHIRRHIPHSVRPSGTSTGTQVSPSQHWASPHSSLHHMSAPWSSHHHHYPMSQAHLTCSVFIALEISLPISIPLLEQWLILPLIYAIWIAPNSESEPGCALIPSGGRVLVKSKTHVSFSKRSLLLNTVVAKATQRRTFLFS